MDKDTQAELDRLEREIWGEDKDLSDILADDVLKDLDRILGEEKEEEAVQQPAADENKDKAENTAEAVEEDEEVEEVEEVEPPVEEEDSEDSQEQASKDGLTIGLMIASIVLCMGIIGVMIYWLENFL